MQYRLSLSLIMMNECEGMGNWYSHTNPHRLSCLPFQDPSCLRGALHMGLPHHA